MAGKYDDKNRGALWPNRKKETDKHPDFTGQINIDGKDYWLSGWKKKSDAREGAPSLSLSVKQKDSKPQSSTRESEQRPLRDELSDDVPF